MRFESFTEDAVGALRSDTRRESQTRDSVSLEHRETRRHRAEARSIKRANR